MTAGPEVELGEGARVVLAADGRGQVVAAYRRAAYVRMPAGLIALTTADVWRGPLHVRSPVRPDRLAPGDRVDVVAGLEMQVGPTTIDLSKACVWRGALPHPGRLAATGDLARVFAGAPPPALAEPRF